jgi:hypothetical protein
MHTITPQKDPALIKIRIILLKFNKLFNKYT